jgi:tetratricopeptide (TPR) repeat protein
MRSSFPFRLALVMAVGTGPALAQTPAAAPPPAPPPAAPAPAAPPPAPAAAPPVAAPPATTAPTHTPVAPPRAGPSPYSEAVQKGDGLLLARDYDGAIAAYRAEIDKNPALGHYRTGEAQLAKGNVAEAEAAWQTALRLVGTDDRLRGKLLFVLSDLKERQKANDDAITRWKEYEQHARMVADAKGYPATAVERVKRNEDWKKISADAAEVRARIKKRIDEADEALRKTSK